MMSQKTRRELIALLGGTATVALAGCSGNGGGDGTTTTGGSDGATTDEMTDGETTEGEMDDEDMTETDTDDEMGDMANVRVSHMSPDAPNVDVYVDGNRALSDVPFRTTSDYLPLPAGSHTVKITAAGDESTVAFEGDVTVEADTDYTVAAVGELTSDDSEFRPLVLEDDNSEPGSGTARMRVVHASPDAPAVDVTLAATGDAVFDGVALGESGYTEAPAGEYTLEVRGDTESNDGDVVADFDVSVSGNTVYTAFAAGYLSPDDEPSDEAFDLVVEQDAGY